MCRATRRKSCPNMEDTFCIQPYLCCILPPYDMYFHGLYSTASETEQERNPSAFLADQSVVA